MNEKSTRPLFCRIPPIFYILAGVFAVAATTQFFAALYPGFADFINGTVGAGIRLLLAKLTDLVPFSVGEWLLMAVPAVIALVIYLAFRADARGRIRILAGVLTVIVLLYSLFVFMLGCGYRTSPLDERLGLVRESVSAAELAATATWLREEVNALSPSVSYRNRGLSVMPYGLDEMNEKLLAAYARVCEQYPFIQSMDTRVKPVVNSEIMSYMHITGIYSYMTGEANVNIVFPDYTLPFTAAHELAHQRGIAREDEANFVAFLVCAASDDPYIQYSGYMNLLEYTAGALVRADREAYGELCAGYEPAVAYEMIAYNEFYKKYQNNPVGNISSSVNNAYLESQGTPGVASYGMVVDLAVAYYRTHS